jgi:hypothetical protein
MSAQRHLRPVETEPATEALIVFRINPQTGELGEKVGPLETFLAEAEAEYNALQGKFRSALAEITKLKSDREADARKHKYWSEAEALHDWWAIAVGRPGRSFGADEFYQVLPRLKEKRCGVIGVLQAIAGAAFDPGSKTTKSGRIERYDDWELINRSQGKQESFANRVPGDLDGHEWKRWLIAHIESQLTTKD